MLFLAIAGIIAVGTTVLFFSDQSLADLRNDLNGIAGRDRDESPDTATQAEMTATAEAMATPTPELMSVPDDLELSAEAAFVIHLEHDAVLFEKNADEQLQPASTAKLITAITVLEYASPDEVIEIIDEDVVDPVAESSMNLKGGDRVTVHDLIVGLMLPSGNDAANALARAIGERIPDESEPDPRQRFINEMNQVANDIGMEQSTLLHAAGHDVDGQSVTARELALAARAVLERPSLVPIVAMRHAEIRIGGDDPRVIPVENTNELLVYDGVYGVKTGTTTEAGQALIAAWRDDQGTIVAVILGSQDRYGDARKLLGLPEPPEPDDEPDPEVESQPES